MLENKLHVFCCPFYGSFNQPILLYLANLVTAGQVTEEINESTKREFWMLSLPIWT